MPRTLHKPKRSNLKSKITKKGGKHIKSHRKGGKTLKRRVQRGDSHRHMKKSGRKTRHYMRGGFGAGAGPIGYAWNGNNGTWPGVYASEGNNTSGMTMSNFLPLNKLGAVVGGVDPALSSRNDIPHLTATASQVKAIQSGGKLTDLLPSVVTNTGSSLMHQGKSIYSDFMGSPNAPVNPLPTVQPIDEKITFIPASAVDLSKMTNMAAQEVDFLKYN
jgi:hypothetical protein